LSKQLSHREVLEVIRQAIEDGETLDSEDKVFGLVSDLAELVGSHLGYMVSGVAPPMEDTPAEFSRHTTLSFEQCWAVGFLPNECTPADGGLLAAYDTDITLKEWWEQGGLDPTTVMEPAGPRNNSGHGQDWMDAYNRTAERQGWGADSERTVLLEFIAERGIGDALPAFAQGVADCENGVTTIDAPQPG
jgi:hypothetical protein